MSLIDLIVAISVVIILFFMLMSWLARPKHVNRHINCVTNLKQINLAFRIWESDNNNLYPMGISITNGGAMELIATGNIIDCFRCISNEMSTTKILVCPNDHDRTFAANFDALNKTHVSYFLNADVTNDSHPERILDGDDNLTIDDVLVKSGLLELATNAPVGWTKERHDYCGNLGFADGSVAEESATGLRTALYYTALATNRLAIP